MVHLPLPSLITGGARLANFNCTFTTWSTYQSMVIFQNFQSYVKLPKSTKRNLWNRGRNVFGTHGLVGFPISLRRWISKNELVFHRKVMLQFIGIGIQFISLLYQLANIPYVVHSYHHLLHNSCMRNHHWHLRKREKGNTKGRPIRRKASRGFKGRSSAHSCIVCLMRLLTHSLGDWIYFDY